MFVFSHPLVVYRPIVGHGQYLIEKPLVLIGHCQITYLPLLELLESLLVIVGIVLLFYLIDFGVLVFSLHQVIYQLAVGLGQCLLEKSLVLVAHY